VPSLRVVPTMLSAIEHSGILLNLPDFVSRPQAYPLWEGAVLPLRLGELLLRAE
jgi:hypothetical protein